ncbi:MAG: 16S rRNA (guanine(966)-N(2))-methyltransferase RsmD [Flavobacteriales bacterium]|nr:16S rRNA (guanine(966)-N(2))-methyltransferase RsmD [Flavobacteriales bacterium]
MFRIISGIHKGKKLLAHKNTTARPTTDFAKEGLFGILSHKVSFHSVTVLDLFAGLGSISLEFASREAPKIYTIENNKVNVKFIHESIKKLQLENQIQVFCQNVFSWIPKNRESFDVVFADPPYDMSLQEYQKLIDLIFSNNTISQNGIFILEHSSRQKPIENQYYDFTRKYGNVSFSFYVNKSQSPEEE